MTKITLYIGLNDKTLKRQIIDTVEATKIVYNIIVDCSDGGTIYNATGIYRHDDGTIVIENTLRVELFNVDPAIVDRIIYRAKIALNQESVIKQTETVTSEFC